MGVVWKCSAQILMSEGMDKVFWPRRRIYFFSLNNCGDDWMSNINFHSNDSS